MPERPSAASSGSRAQAPGLTLEAAYTHSMLAVELLLALIVVLISAVGAALVWLVQGQTRQASELARVEGEIAGQSALGWNAQDQIRQQLADAKGTLDLLKGQIQARHEQDSEGHRALRRLEAVLAGSKSLGTAGENIIAESLAAFPDAMVARQARINGKVVEFALRLPNGKLVPIDSKWPASSVLGPEDALDAPGRERRQAEIERQVRLRVREARAYIDIGKTTPWVIAAIPDSAFQACRASLAQASKSQVVVIPYSMALPYLITLYHLYLQFSRDIDSERLQAALLHLGDGLRELDQIFENRIFRAEQILTNAYRDGKKVQADMLTALDGIRGAATDADTASGLPGANIRLLGDTQREPCD